MKLCMVLLAILYLVNARTLQDSDNEKHRHRRRTRYPFYDYYDRNYYDKMDYGRDDSITEIIHLLQEISSYVKRPPPPPPPPQIIYVPYPVSYPVPCRNIPNITDKFPDMEDENMNWGIVTGDKGTNMESEGDGSRPISLKPIEPSELFPEMPPVEHGSNQAGMPTTTKAPALKSRICQAAILICCDNQDEEERKQCFYQYNCLRTYSTGISCHKIVINKAFEEFTKAYGPR